MLTTEALCIINHQECKKVEITISMQLRACDHSDTDDSSVRTSPGSGEGETAVSGTRVGHLLLTGHQRQAELSRRTHLPTCWHRPHSNRWPWTPITLTEQHGTFGGLSDMRYELVEESNMSHVNFLDSTGRHYFFLKSTCDMASPPPPPPSTTPPPSRFGDLPSEVSTEIDLFSQNNSRDSSELPDPKRLIYQ